MPVHVASEVGRLRSVLVHRPGNEVARMTQYELEQLLFDDLLSPKVAAQEHDLLRAILEADGATVHDLAPLLATALARAPSDDRQHLVQIVCEAAGAADLTRVLLDLEPNRLVAALIEGLYWSEIAAAPTTLSRLRARHDGEAHMALPPLPNLMFTRDPCFSVRDRVVMGRMATPARSREPLLVRFALVHSGLVPPERMLFAEDDRHKAPMYRCIEGGDVLVLGPTVLLIGCSERTRAHTIERLASEALFPAFPDLQRIYAVFMPALRSLMHLDTILTQVDRTLFLGHEPLLLGEASAPAAPVVTLERDAPPHANGGTVVDVLRDELGPEVRVAPCGGTERLHQHREQWTDGANALCIAPGKVVLYRRNAKTIDLLCREHGFTTVTLSSLDRPEERARKMRMAAEPGRVVFAFSGSELSRARGGGRCLTMPLVRDP